MERILFVVPPCIRFADFIDPAYNIKTQQKNDGIYGNVVTDMPLGVLALSSYVKEHCDVAVELVDFTIILNKMMTFEEESFKTFFHSYLSRPEIKAFNPTVIAISVLFTPAYQNMIDIAIAGHDIFPEAVVVAGGGVPQNMYKNAFQDFPELDGICYGEGELPFVKLLQAEDKHKYLEESTSWMTKATDSTCDFQHDFIEDLDEIPFYDYDLCDVQDYSMNPAYPAYAGSEVNSLNYHVMTSRGCPQHCTFCASHTIHGRKMRYYSVERVREDFKALKERYGASKIVFQDDHLMGDQQRALRVINIAGELDFTAVFQNGLALYGLKRPMLEAIRSAGTEQLTLPVESGSQRVLKKIMKKPLSLNIVDRVVKDCRDLGLYTNVNILIGMPGETKEDIEEARLFLSSINPNWFVILFATPLAGSEMLDVCLENGYLKGSYVDTDYKKPIIETEEWDRNYITTTAYNLNLELNFVHNSDFFLGEYKTALKGFENTIKAKHDHGFAHHYTGLTYEKLGDDKKAKFHLNKAKEICEEQPFWGNLAEKYSLCI